MFCVPCCSRNRWDGLIKAWKKSIHKYDEQPDDKFEEKEEEEEKESEEKEEEEECLELEEEIEFLD